MITHNLGVVRETSNHVYVMNKGVVVEQGPTSQHLRSAEGRIHARPHRGGATPDRRHAFGHAEIGA
jgi:ABC-type glutathione transport system ATPase component